MKNSAQPDFKLVLAKDAQQIKRNEVNSAFYQTQLNVFPAQNRIDVRGVLKTWIGNGKPQSEIKDYSIQIAYENGVTSIVKFWEVTNDKP